MLCTRPSETRADAHSDTALTKLSEFQIGSTEREALSGTERERVAKKEFALVHRPIAATEKCAQCHTPASVAVAATASATAAPDAR